MSRWLPLVILLLTTPAHAARQFNGTSDFGASASAINLSATSVGTYCAWLWWDSFSSGDDRALDHNPGGTPRVEWNPDSGAALIRMTYVGNVGATDAEVTANPTAAAWHHYCVVYDISAASNEVEAIYIDGSSVSVTRNNNSNNTSALPNTTLYLMSNTGVANFGAGRMAELTVWNVKLTSGNVTSLYGGGVGAACVNPATVGSGPSFYWPLDTNGTATIGGINITLTGTTTAAHPCGVAGGGGSGPSVIGGGLLGSGRIN